MRHAGNISSHRRIKSPRLCFWYVCTSCVCVITEKEEETSDSTKPQPPVTSHHVMPTIQEKRVWKHSVCHPSGSVFFFDLPFKAEQYFHWPFSLPVSWSWTTLGPSLPSMTGWDLVSPAVTSSTLVWADSGTNLHLTGQQFCHQNPNRDSLCQSQKIRRRLEMMQRMRIRFLMALKKRIVQMGCPWTTCVPSLNWVSKSWESMRQMRTAAAVGLRTKTDQVFWPLRGQETPPSQQLWVAKRGTPSRRTTWTGPYQTWSIVADRSADAGHWDMSQTR